MQSEQLDDLKTRGIEALEKGYIHSAQVFLAQLVEQQDTPEAQSYLAYCLAIAKGQTQAAIETCHKAMTAEPENPTHYLLLGRSYLLLGKKKKAISMFRKGLKKSADPRIIKELNKLGLRKSSVFKNLRRDHPANKIMGKLLSRLGLR